MVFKTQRQYLAELTNGGLGTGNARIQNIITATSSEGQITCIDSNGGGSTPVPLNIVASDLLLNGTPVSGGGGSQNLASVLTIGNDAGGQDITNVNQISAGSINTSILSANPSGSGTYINMYSGFEMGNNQIKDTANGSVGFGNNLNMNGLDIVACNNIYTTFINGLSPTTIGLTWGSFTGTNAYTNLPLNSYVVDNSTYSTTQSASQFKVEYPAMGYSSILEDQYLSFNGSGTYIIYSANNISVNTGNPFAINVNSGTQPLYLTASEIYFNGSPLPIPKSWIGSNSGTAFSVGSGSWSNVGIGSSPIITLSGLNPSQSYWINVNLSVFTDTDEPTGAMYLNYSNAFGGFNAGIYSDTKPVAGLAKPNIFTSAGSSASTQFHYNDWVNFTADGGGYLSIDMFFGHNGGTWSGIYVGTLG